MSILRRFGSAFGRLGPLQKALAIIGVGVLGFVLLMVLRPRPEHQEPARRMPLVTTVPADVRSGNLTVRGSGTVRPKSEIVLSPQVAGRVLWVAPAFVSGGRFQRGDFLLRIEAADYENAVEAAAATVAQRQVEVMQWEQERELAREEYERLRAREGIEAPPDSGALGSLIFREPQLQAAKAALRSAEARLDDAHLALARTRITAPFDGLVRAKSVDIGQYVAPGQNLGSLFDTDEVEIVVPSRTRRRPWWMACGTPRPAIGHAHPGHGDRELRWPDLLMGGVRRSGRGRSQSRDPRGGRGRPGTRSLRA